MICIYEKTTSDFNNNGLGVLEPMECTFKPIINNVWSLEMTLPYDAEGKSQLIANDRILKVTDIDCISEQTSDHQLFRIYDFKKEDRFISVIAYPIGLDARFDTFVDSVKMNYKTASQAISQMNSLSSKYTVSGSGYSSAVKSAEYANANLISILNGDNGFVQVWDGEICYDNYNIKVNHRLGSSSNPLDVRYGKNITGISYDMDASNIITQLYPKSKDNYPLNINNRNYVNASNFADYPIPHMYYVQAPYNLVQLSNDGSEEYLMSIGIFDHIKTLTANWLKQALSNDEIYGGLLKEIELDWINNNYDLTTINDGVQGIVEYLWRKLIGSSHANITHGAVQSLIYNAMKAGFDDVLKNSDSGYYIGSASKKLMDSGFGTQFYSYEWDTVGDYRVTPDGEGYVWVYASSKWNQLDTNGETTGATDKTKWKWYKVKGQSYKRYGNKKKKRYLKSQWWKINDVWYYYGSNGKSNKGSTLTSIYYEYFEDAEIILDEEQQTIYDILTDVCSNGESQLVGLLNNQMEQYCLNLFENEKLSYPTEKLDINMVDLSQTTEYKDFQSLERIHLGDSVKVYNPRLGIESTVRVIGLTYDVLRKMNTEIQIGVTETSVINLLNNIGKGSDEVRYVAGDGITIENNTISIVPPTKPYLEDVLLNGESVVRNHKAYIDLDELGIDESIDVLYGEEEPDDEDDGEDKDFYLIIKEATDSVLLETDYTTDATETNPISVTSFTRKSATEYDFDITGKPASGYGERLYFNMHGLVAGNTYTINFKGKYSDGTTFPYYPQYNAIFAVIIDGIGTSVVMPSDTQQHDNTITFVAGTENKLHYYLSSADGVFTTLSITDFEIVGSTFSLGEIEEIYNKHEGMWKKYTPHEMIGATSESDGQSGTVPQPTIADREKYLRGDGTWQDAQGASAVSDLTDVKLTNLADGEILEWDAEAEKWKNVANSGGGGTGGSSVYTCDLLIDQTIKAIGNYNFSKNISEYDAVVIAGDAWRQSSSSDNKSMGITMFIPKEDYLTRYVQDGWGFAFTYQSQRTTFNIDVTNNCLEIGYVDVTSNPAYINKVYGLKFGTLSPIIYSEEEREVGVWLDNKPLYCKTIDIGQLPNNSTKSINLDSAIELIVNYSGVMYGNAGGDNIKWNRPLPFTDNTITNITRVANDNNVLKITTASDWRGYNGYLTIWYTKTTDVAGSGSYNTLGVPNVHYTSDWHVVGTWWNGKPIYEKTFHFTTANLPADRETIEKIYDFDELVSIEGAFGYQNYAQDRRAYALGEAPPQLSSRAIYLLCEGVTNEPNIMELDFNFNGNDRSKIVYMSATVRYTKTTD